MILKLCSSCGIHFKFVLFIAILFHRLTEPVNAFIVSSMQNRMLIP